MSSLPHHAFLIVGKYGSLKESLYDYLRKEFGVTVAEDAVIIERSYRSLTIDDAKEVRDIQLRRTGDDRVSLFFIDTVFFLREAQNAYLKMLEEPSPRTHFFIITPYPELLLPTLRSRLSTAITLQHGSSNVRQGEDFLNASFSEREAYIEPLIESADRAAAEELLRSLVISIRERIGEAGSEKFVKSLPQLESLRVYSTDPSSSLKMMLGYAVLATPLCQK